MEVLLDAAPDRAGCLADSSGITRRLHRSIRLVVSRAVQRMTTGQMPDLASLIPRFCRERFLYDYLDDAKLLARLNRVMGRVKLPQLPPEFAAFLPAARQQVTERREELLSEPSPKESEEAHHEIRNEPAAVDGRSDRSDPADSGEAQGNGL